MDSMPPLTHRGLVTHICVNASVTLVIVTAGDGYSVIIMMTSSNGNIFRLTAALWEEFTGDRLIPLIKASDQAFMFPLTCARINGWANNREAGDLRRYRDHYDVTVMIIMVPVPGSVTVTVIGSIYLAPSLYPWWRHQMETFSALLALCAGNSPVPVNSPHKGQWRGALVFSLIYPWINDWVNNREAGDLRRQRGHYDVIVMSEAMPTSSELGLWGQS